MLSCTPPATSSLSVWPVALPKNRVGGSAVFSFVFAFQYIGQTLDTPAENGGCGYDFASGIHKYLYAANNPINMSDPSGNDYGDFDIILPAYLSQDGDDVGKNSAGPDVTTKVMNTMADVKQTFEQAVRSNPSLKNNLYQTVPWGMRDGWDIDPLYELGYGGASDVGYGTGALFPWEFPKSFGYGTYPGSGTGLQTVQFSFNGLHVYYAGSVNYILWGEIYALLESSWTAPDVHDYSEQSAVAFAWAHKSFGEGDWGITKLEADAFVRFGYGLTFQSLGINSFGVGVNDPSSTALSVPPDPLNAPNGQSAGRMPWKWIGIPGHEQAE